MTLNSPAGNTTSLVVSSSLRVNVFAHPASDLFILDCMTVSSTTSLGRSLTTSSYSSSSSEWKISFYGPSTSKRTGVFVSLPWSVPMAAISVVWYASELCVITFACRKLLLIHGGTPYKSLVITQKGVPKDLAGIPGCRGNGNADNEKYYPIAQESAITLRAYGRAFPGYSICPTADGEYPPDPVSE